MVSFSKFIDFTQVCVMGYLRNTNCYRLIRLPTESVNRHMWNVGKSVRET